MITLEQAKGLTTGTLYHVKNRNADGTPQRWKINGKVKTWKRFPDAVKIPVKNGLRNCDYITETSLHLVCLTESEALQAK